MVESLPRSEPVLLPDRSFGRQARSVLAYALLTALMIISPMVVFVPAALLHCALRNGRRAAWAVLVLSMALASLSGAAAAAADRNGTWAYLAAVALAIALPAVAAVPMVERGEAFGRVFVFLLAGSMVGFALTEIGMQTFLSFSPYADHVARVKEVLGKIVQFYRDNNMPADFIRSAEQGLAITIYTLPAYLLLFASVVHVLSLMMLGRLQAWREPVMRAYLFRNFGLPDWVLFAFVFGGLTPLTGGLLQKVAANVLLVVAVLYMLQGLAVFRSMLLTMNAGLGGTLLGWAVLVLMFPFSLLLLGMAGLFDPFFDFRHFKKRKDDSHESHSD